jgi:Alr-MurF fusion protein
LTHPLKDIARITHAKWLQKHQPDAPIAHLVLDSRQMPPPQSLFFALPGQRHDGHRYLQSAYNSGVRHFVVSRHEVPLAGMPEADVLYVTDSLEALQQVAAWHRAQYNYPVVGITGSNGKTVVKEWLYQLIRPDRVVVRSPKSYNSQVGVPLSVWQMQSHHEVAIIEAGISRPGEMARLETIVRPTVGIFTMLGRAHSEGFEDDKQKFEEKMRLFAHCPVLIACADQGHEFPQVAGRQLVLWSAKGNPADVTIEINEPDEGRSMVNISTLQKMNVTVTLRGVWLDQVRATHPDAPAQVTLEVGTDAAALENAVHAWLAGVVLGGHPVELAARVATLEPVAMRLELLPGIQQSVLINDSYSLDLTSLSIALQFAVQQGKQMARTLILSDFVQSGLTDGQLWPEVARLVQIHGFSRVVGIGGRVRDIVNWLPATVECAFFEDTQALLSEANSGHFNVHNQIVVIKGARQFGFEQIAHRLEQKAHKTVLEVNLSALVHNLNVYNSYLRSGVRMLAMVKAAGYGSGAVELARLLEFHGVDYLGVAYTDEGIELRQAGISLPIMVLNPTAADFDAMYRYRLEPEIYSLELLRELGQFASSDRPMACHLKLDTGMHRLGFSASDIPELLAFLSDLKGIKVRSIFSHLSASDAPGHDEFTHAQGQAFVRMANLISEELGYAPLRHIANSSGIVRFPEFHFDMVRLGIGLYGIADEPLQARLRPVLTFKATISQVHTVPKGDTVGYNRNSGPLDRDRRIATISVGYADGFLRLAGGGRYAVLVRDQLAPTIGNVCMDMTMIDVTHIPNAQAGDEVVVFGSKPTAHELARVLQTIPYEVFTNLSERVKRVYVQE